MQGRNIQTIYEGWAQDRQGVAKWAPAASLSAFALFGFRRDNLGDRRKRSGSPFIMQQDRFPRCLRGPAPVCGMTQKSRSTALSRGPA